MEWRVVGEGDRDLLFVMGWGNRAGSGSERWFLERLAEAGFRVHAAEIPTNITDFEREYLAPVRAYLGERSVDAVLGHSTGGLIVAHLEVPATPVYLAPWWGIHALGHRRLQAAVLPRLPTAAPVVPVGFDPGALLRPGDRVLPRVSPAFLREIRAAQRWRPPIEDDAVVFCSLSDTVVSLAAVGEAVDREQVRLYDGGHELFSSAGRRGATERVIDALEARVET